MPPRSGGRTIRQRDALKSALPKGQGAANLSCMSKLVNLRTIRKQAARDAKRRAGDANAARHGRTLAERQAERAQADAARTHLDAHKRET